MTEPPHEAADLIVVSDAEDSTVGLYFDGLPERLRRRMVVLAPRAVRRELLLQATAVILVRKLKRCEGIIETCRAAGIPLYYFLDDNVTVLSREEHGWRAYGIEAMRARLAGFAGVMLASERLLDYYREAGLHAELSLWPPVLPAPAPLRDPAAPASTLAFIGGEFRVRAMNATLMPALAEAAPGRPLRLHLRAVERQAYDAAALARLADAAVAVEEFPFALDFAKFTARALSWKADLLLHPRADTANADYKTLGTLAVAHMIGALPVVAREGAYTALSQEDGILALPDDRAAWRDALGRLLRDAAWLQALRGRFAAYCARTFAGREATALLDAILERHRPDGSVLAERQQRAGRAPRRWPALRLRSAR
jgi:hypothetical protein